jgi:hypothetical protein
MVMATDEQLWYGMASKPAKADPLAEARKKAREEEEAAAKAEEEEFKQKTADILRGPKAAAKSLAKSAAMIAADPMGANPEAAAEVVERGAEYLGKGYDYLKEKISPEEVAGPAAAIAAFDPELFRGSKITTETGEPLTVYHGTPPGWDAEGRAVPRSFRDFDPSMFGHQYGQRFGPGIYFSTAPATASRYAAQMPTEAYFPEGSDLPEMRHPALSPERDPEGFTRVKDSGDRKMGGSVLRAAVTIKNPYDWPSSGDRAVGGLHGLVVERERLPDDIHDAVVARAGFDPSRKTNWKLHPKFEDLYVPFGTPRTHTTNLSEIHLEERAMQIMGDALKEELTSRGHDGIRITQPTYGHRYVRDPEWRLDESGEWRQVEPSKVAPTQEAYRTGTEQEIVAFHPEQVRQAPRAAAPEAPRAPEGWDQPRPFEINHQQGVGTDHWGNEVHLDYIDEVDIKGTRSTMRPVYYHVTLSENVTDIVNDGIRVGEGQNWQRATGEAYGASRVHTFADYESARRWAHKMETAMFGDQVFSSPKGEVAIIAHSGGTWQTDPSVSPLEGGSALQRSEAVPPEQVIGYESYDRDQRGQRGPEIAWDSVDGRFDTADKRYRLADVERTLAPVATINAAMDEIRAPGSDHVDTIKRLGRGQLNDAQVQEVFDRWQRWALKERKLPSNITAVDLVGILEEVRDAPQTPSTSRPKRGGQGTVGTIGGIAGLGIAGALAAQAARGTVPEEVRDAGVEAFYRFKGGKPIEARELDPKSKAVQAFAENEEALQWALQNNRISEDAYKQLSSLRK